MKHLFIINRHSFRDKTKLEKLVLRIKDFFASQNNTDYEIYKSDFPRDALVECAGFLKKMPPEDAARIYAVGGDGILFDCLNGIMENKNVQLALIPYGNINEFLHSFVKIPKYSLRWKIDKSWRDIERQFNAETLPVDVIKCNKHYALNYCALGVEPNTFLKTNSLLNSNKADRFHPKAYAFFRFMSAFEGLAKNRFYKVKIDGETLDGHYIGINIVNGNYYGYNRPSIQGASVTDGKLDVLLIKTAPLFTLCTTYIYYSRGQWLSNATIFTYRSAKEVEIKSDKTFAAALDGEIFYETELNISVMPGALDFVVVKEGD
jgi:diacylglycerol kinase family enzyme